MICARVTCSHIPTVRQRSFDMMRLDGPNLTPLNNCPVPLLPSMASDHLQHATTTSPCLMEVPAPDKGLPEPDTASTAAFLAMSHDMQLPLVTK